MRELLKAYAAALFMIGAGALTIALTSWAEATWPDETAAIGRAVMAWFQTWWPALVAALGIAAVGCGIAVRMAARHART